MYGDGYSGGEELTQDELDTYNQEYENVLLELQKAAEQSDEARAFLATPLGQALRKAIVQEKLEAMKAIAEHAMDQDFMQYKHQYDVICGVERIFSLIITDGEQAIAQMRVKVTEDE